MNMSLTANWLATQPARSVCNYAKQQMAPFEFVAICITADIHHNGINRVRSLALRVPQARPDVVESPIFWIWTEDSLLIAKAHVRGAVYSKFRIELHVLEAALSPA